MVRRDAVTKNAAKKPATARLDDDFLYVRHQVASGRARCMVFADSEDSRRRGAPFDAAETVEVPMRLHADDSAAQVRRKVSAALGLPSPAHVYLFVVTKRRPSPQAAATLGARVAEQVLRGRDSLTRSELVTVMTMMTEFKSRPMINKKKGGDDDNDEILTPWQATRLATQYLLEDSKRGERNLCQPLDFRYTLDGYVQYFRPDPMFVDDEDDDINVDANMVMGDGTPRHVYSLVRLEGFTLETLCPPGSYLCVCTAADVMRHVRGSVPQPWRDDRERLYRNGYLRKYFPLLDVDDRRDLGPTSDALVTPKVVLDADLVRSERILRALVAGSAERLLSWSYVQVRVASHSLGRLDLRSVFDGFCTSPQVPMLILWDGVGSLFKVHSPSLRDGTLSDGRVSSWVQARPKETADEAYLEFIVMSSTAIQADTRSSTAYGKLILRADTSYELRQGFPNFSETAETQVGPRLERIYETAGRAVSSMLGGQKAMRVPPLDPLVLRRHPSESDSLLSNSVLTATLKSPRKATLVSLERAAAALPTLFVVVHRGARMLILRYRRADTPSTQASVEEALASVRDMPREQAVERLQDLLGLSEGDAAARFDEFMSDEQLDDELSASSPFRRRHVSELSAVTATLGLSRNPRPVIVRLFPVAVGHRAQIEGCTSVLTARRAHDALVLLVTAAADAAVLRGLRSAESHGEPKDVAADVGDVIASEEAISLEADKDLNELLELELSSAIASANAAANNVKNASRNSGSSKAVDVDVDVDGNDDDDASSGNKVLLNQLYRADPELFRPKLSSGLSYASVCGKHDGRQPVVITSDELARIKMSSPDSIAGYVHAGSTPEHEQRNIYICPYVWCPKSRVSMTLEEFNKNGRQCADPSVSETPMVLDAKYWQGRPKYPGFLEPRHHPRGLCMPCCFRRPDHKAAECDKGRAKTNTGDDDRTLQPDFSVRYIRGDQFPLGKDMYGILPHEAHAFFQNKRRCGNRDDGSGQIVASTRCFVRRGLNNTRQPFLQALMHVLELPSEETVIAQLLGAADMASFLRMEGGATCRKFLPVQPDLADAGKLQSFATALGQDAKQLTTEARRFLSVPRDQRAAFLRKEPRVCLLYVFHCALQSFRLFLQDARLVKGHEGLVDLFNAAHPALNPRALNLVVLERVADALYALAPTPSADGYRLDKPFVFLVKQGPYYEPLYRIRLERSRVVGTMLHAYDGSSPVRSIVDGLIATKDGAPRWGALLQILRALGQPAAYQVVDLTFRVVAYATAAGMLVPLPTSTSVLPSNTGLDVAYVHGARALIRKPIGEDAALAFFAQLARIAEDDSFQVRARLPQGTKKCRALVLRSGFVVPLDAAFEADAPAKYLENLNIVIGLQLADDRTRLFEKVKALEDAQDAALHLFIAVVLGNSQHMQEYRFLRSSFNPFPLDYRRAKMNDLVSRVLGERAKKSDAKDDLLRARLTEQLLYGTDPLGSGGAKIVATGRRVCDGQYVVFSDGDLLGQTVDAVLKEKLTEQEFGALTKPGAASDDATNSQVQVVQPVPERVVLNSLRSDGQRDSKHATATTDDALHAFALGVRARRRPWSLLHNVDLFKAAALLSRYFVPGASLTPRALRMLVGNRYVRDNYQKNNQKNNKAHKNDDVGEGFRRILSDHYVPGLYDAQVLAEELRMNIVVIEAVNRRIHVTRHKHAPATTTLSAVLVRKANDGSFHLILNGDSDHSSILFTGPLISAMLSTWEESLSRRT